MQTLEVRLPDSVAHQLKELAKQEGISLNQMLVTAASNEVIRQETRSFFSHAANSYNPQAFADALDAVPDAPSIASD